MGTLVIVAHADDETLSMGGTIAMAPAGSITVAVLCSGRVNRSVDDRDTHTQFQKACAMLGAASLEASFPDQQLELVGSLKINQQVEAWIQDLQPDVIYSHHIADVNIDHRIVAQAAHVACRPPWRGTLWAFDNPSSTEWSAGLREPRFAPNMFLELTLEALEKKITTMETFYRAEMRPYPHPRSRLGLEARAMWRGMQGGMKYAEAFQLIKQT